MTIGENMQKLFRKIDKPLFFMTLLYTILGLIMVLSASNVSAVLRYDVTPYYFFIRQLIFITIAYIAGFIVLKIHTKYYKRLSFLYMIFVIILLGLVYLFGKIAGGAQSWLNFGFFNIQPTEFAKTAIIIYMGCFYEKSLKKQKKFSYNFIPLIFISIMAFFIYKQPDLGGVIIILGISFLIFLSIPFSKKNKIKLLKLSAVAIAIAAVIILAMGNRIFNSSQKQRLNFFSPCSRYMEDSGYQVCNGFIAFHNGGIFGVGLGNSTQKYLYLPEAHTDFIFPIIVEELGLITGIAIIIGYIYILSRILKIAKKADALRNQIICYGTFIYLLLHLLINFLGILALIPLTGVPLPLLSYGGSFNLNVIVMLFLVQRINIETEENEQKRRLNNL